MTDRLKGCVVVFSEDIREDDARPILLAIEQLKGVASVHTALSTVDVGDLMNRHRVRTELRAKILAALDAP